MKNDLKSLDLGKYMGEWVVICNNKVLAHDKKITNLKKQIDSCKKPPLIAKIPKEDTYIF